MCLKTVVLNTKKTRKDGFVGIGYKALYLDEKKFIKSKLGIWQKARRWHGYDVNAGDGTVYYPGFHIFLNENDAKVYCNFMKMIVQVSFKEIICFGTNWTMDGSKDCVIANWMRFDKILTT